MLLATTVGLVAAGGPLWLIKLMAAFLALAVIMYLGTYIYCLFKDPDALRSETYSLQKMAIEHGFFGDSESGIFEPGSRSAPKKPKEIEAKPDNGATRG